MLVETSAWIEFVRKKGNAMVKDRVADELANRTAAFTCPTRYELLSSCTRQIERDLIADVLKMSKHIPFEPADWMVAADGGLQLARRGIRVSAFDLLTSAVAARTGVGILTLDAHYEAIRTHAIAALEIERIKLDVAGK